MSSFFRKKRKGWDRDTRKTHAVLDIDNYLNYEAEIDSITQEMIDEYKSRHQNRIYDKYKVGYRSRYIDYSHGDNPFCKLCNENYEAGDDIFIFHVGGYTVYYHVECFKNTRETKQRNVIYQDRAYRRKN